MALLHGWWKRRLRWARGNPLLWCHWCLAAVTAVVIAWPTAPAYDFHLRLLGTALQFVGIATVAVDLIQARRDHGQEGFFTRTLMWLRSYPDPEPILQQAEPTQSVTKILPIRWKYTPPGNPSPEEMVQIQLTGLDRDVDRLWERMATVENRMEDALAQQQAATRRTVRQLEAKLARSMTASGALLAFGAVWLTVGVVLGTIAPEVKCFVNWLR